MLPNDAGRLLKTSVIVLHCDAAGGQYHHTGIENGVRKMMNVLQSNDIQSMYNWTEVNGKQSFKKLGCCDILHRKPICRIFSFPS